MEFRTGFVITITNYLDDFLLIAYMITRVNQLMVQFLDLCKQVGCPVSDEKTEWGTQVIVFLGMLLDGRNFTLSIADEKRRKAQNVLQWVLAKRTVTVHLVQKLCGLLNFLNRAIVPGRTFTRSMYNRLKLTGSNGVTLKPYHHITLDKDFHRDAEIWLIFLQNLSLHHICRPFTDLNAFEYASELQFFMDATKSQKFGMGAVFGDNWMVARWGDTFIKEQDPSIEYLELFALVAGILVWSADLETVGSLFSVIIRQYLAW